MKKAAARAPQIGAAHMNTGKDRRNPRWLC
jgi:hypothetical protein